MHGEALYNEINCEICCLSKTLLTRKEISLCSGERNGRVVEGHLFNVLSFSGSRLATKDISNQDST